MSTDTTDTSPFILYGRTSRKNGRGGENFIAPETQEEDCVRIARAHGLPYVDGEFFYDSDVSGGTFVREEFDRALELIKKGDRAGFVFPYFSRFARTDVGSTLKMVAEIEGAGGQLYDNTGQITVATTMGEAFTTMKSMFSRMEHREKAEGLARAVAKSIEKGKHLTAPFGYAKKDGHLVVVEREAKVVRLMFDRRADGWSWSRIAEAANATGVYPRPRKRDGVVQEAAWTAQTVSQLTRNPAYVGTAWNGELRTPRAHRAIVDAELWAKVEEMRGVKPTRKDGRRDDGALLSGGLARCSGCGHALVRDGAYYRCRREKERRGSCPAPATANAADLEREITGEFEEKALGEMWDADPTGETVELAEAELEEAVGMVRMVKAMISPSLTDITLAELQRDLAEADRRVAVKVEELNRAKMAARGLELPPELDRKRFRDAPTADQRHWMSRVFETVVVRKSGAWREPVADRITFLLRGKAPVSSSTALIGWVASRSW